MSTLTPASAEAAITPRDAQSADTLARMEAQPQPTQDAQIQSNIVSAARNTPENVNVRMAPAGFKTFGRTDYPEGADPEITVDPNGPHVPKTVAHELLHFLNYATMKKVLRDEAERDATVAQMPWYKRLIQSPFQPNSRTAGFALGPVDAQHEFINFLLGKEKQGNTSDPALTSHTFPDYRPVYKYAIGQIFKDPALRNTIQEAQDKLPHFRPDEK
jgi:hypothetical protein